MKTIAKYILLFGLSITMFQFMACEDSLDVEVNSKIGFGNFPANGEEAEAILIGAYSNLKSEFNSTLYGTDRSDALEVGVIGTVSDSWTQELTDQNGTSWLNFYNTIGNINLLISVIDDLNFSSEDDRNNLRAQAYYLRATYYFYMARIWGDIPLVLDPVLNANVEPQPRTPVAEVFEQINEDINTAISLFPDTGFNNKILASMPAAYALLADVKMWTGKVLNGGVTDFDAALVAIQNVENSGVVLLDDFGDVFDTRLNDEIIFAIFNSRDELSLHYGRTLSVRDVNLDPSLSPEVPWSPGGGVRHNYSPSEAIRNLFTDPDDLRADRTFLPFFLSSGSEPVSYSQNKYRGEDIDGIRTWTDDFIIYRWSDMLLLRAEAYAAKNDIPNALIALNQVRNRAGIADLEEPIDRQSLNMEILDERGRELFLELKRWWDLRRFHADGTIDVYQVVPNLIGKDTPLYWPVDQQIIVENPLIEQTQGY